MSFVKLKDLRDRFEREWINGDFKFGYLSDINADHDIDYPLLLVTPPNSTITDDVSDMADYEFEIHLFKPYHQNQSGSLDVVFDLLEQEGLSWLQSVLDSYVVSEVILDGDIALERRKERFNDKLLQVTMSFTLNTFRKAFGDYDRKRIVDLSPIIWLRGDLGVKTTFSGGSEVATKWIDQSGNGNHFQQTDVKFMPIYSAEEKITGHPMLSFNGSNQYMSCVNKNEVSGSANGLSPEFSVMWVAEIEDTAKGTILGKALDSGTKDRFGIYYSGSASFRVDVTDAGGDALNYSSAQDNSGLVVMTMCVKNSQLKVYANGQLLLTDNNASYDPPLGYDDLYAMVLGSSQSLGGGVADDYFKGFVYEMIVFNDDLTGDQVKISNNYLQHKYGI